MIRFLLYALLIWFLYKLIFGLIIPVYNATRQMKKKFGEMHGQVQEEEMKQKSFNSQPAKPQPSSKSPAGDYIDFEEIK